jgi:hypothetical protein
VWEGDDAVFAPSGATVEVAGGTWSVPSTGQCLSCHTEAADASLGMHTLQLNGDFDYPGGVTANQIDTLVHIGLASSPGDPDALDALPDPYGSAPLADRARAWLHANCAQCHTSGGTAPVEMTLDWGRPLADLDVCEAPEAGDLGIPGAQIVAPGDPDRSVLLARIRALDVNRMPPLASQVVDEGGADLIEEWIRSLSSCE